MAADRTIGSFLHEIRIPVLAAMIWAVLGLLSTSISGPVIDNVWLAVRVALVGAAGFLVTRGGRFGLWYAALAGAVVMLADHVLVKGLAFLAAGELEAALGVVVSYLMFAWVAALVGA